MTREPLDDSQIAELVHDVADGWTMPPVRLDSPAWRDRVRSPGRRRIADARGWLARAGRAATAAVALTVVAAFLAIMVTRPPADPGASGRPSDGATPGASDGARPSPLPKLLAQGEPPSPSRVIVQGEPAFAIVDLETGTLGAALTDGTFGSQLQARLEGDLVCLCLTESGSAAGRPTTATVRLDRFDADGSPISSHAIRTFQGEADPRDATRILPDRPPNVVTAMSFSEGYHYGFVGWSRRAGAAWESGLLVVDLQDGAVLSEIAFPGMTSGDEDSRRVVQAPKVVGQAGTGLVIARSWYEFTPPDSESATYTVGTEVFRATLKNGDLLGLLGVPGMDGCGDNAIFGGVLPDDGTWVACTDGFSATKRLRRVAADGRVLDDVTVEAAEGIEGDTMALSPDGTDLYAWDPRAAVLTRIDTATGATSTGRGRTATAETGPPAGPLAALGRWLAPAAAAKSFLASSVLVSPDGSRVYAIGITDGAADPEVDGSAGVFVFDAATLDLLDTYEPAADFVSLGIGTDGRFLYATGLPGVDAQGRRLNSQGASITVFDTSDGSTVLIAGQLGSARLTFGPEPLR